jgi:hypothetical protein
MQGTGGGNSSSSGWHFGIEETKLRVGMGAAVSGDAKGAFHRGREEGSGQGGGRPMR